MEVPWPFWLKETEYLRLNISHEVRTEWSLVLVLHVCREESHCASPRVPAFSISTALRARFGQSPEHEYRLTNQDPISHRLQISRKETNHLFYKVRKIKKNSSDDINTCLCLYCYWQEKTEFTWLRLTLDCFAY